FSWNGTGAARFGGYGPYMQAPAPVSALWECHRTPVQLECKLGHCGLGPYMQAPALVKHK
ncbi:hypothetical protein PY89_13045, partial [Lacticaseibacillus rhamnosus]